MGRANATSVLCRPPFVHQCLVRFDFSAFQARAVLRRVRQLRLAERRHGDGRAEELQRPSRRLVGVVHALQPGKHPRHHHRRHRHRRHHRHLLHRLQQVQLLSIP